MAVNEQIVTGRAHRVLIDKVAKLWQKISFWTKSSDVEFNDGKSAETKVGAIDGITDSLASTSSRIAASAKALSTVNNKLVDAISKITQSIRYIDYASAADLSNIGTGATITEDGVVRMIATRYGTGACEPKLYINDVMVSSQNIGTYGNSNTESNYFPVRKGDTIRATFSGCDSGRVEFCRFRN